jgi:malonyl CoA-acyl carrier protein transacylase
MLSNVTAGLYPDDAEGIREYILDLDENPVRWVECVDVMWRQYKARHFLELGPADTLCGLIGVNKPEALCIAAGRKGKEAENLRAAVARLYELGHLPGAGACVQPCGVSMSAPQAAPPPAPPEAAPPVDSALLSPEAAPAHVEELMPILMEATGLSRRELHPDMDLRYDLSLRSSRFPLIMHEVEKRFGLTLRFDDLLGVATVRDLADRIRHLRQAREQREELAQDVARPPAASEWMHPEQGGPGPRPFSQLPESLAPEAEAALDLSRHFSHFRELWLADARPWPDSPHACLLPSMLLAALMEGAAQLFPELTPAGAEDISFSTAACPVGVTREGHVRCRALRVQPDGPQCQAELRLRDLMPNGRAKRSSSPVCAARILLTPDLAKAPVPVLPEPARMPESAAAASAGREAARNFYERHTGLGPRFRLLTAVHIPEEKRLLAHMRVPVETDVAGLEDSGYIYPSDAFEAAAQASAILALHRNAWQDDTCRMALSRVAAVYFSRNRIPGETLELEVRANADEPGALCCDAELRDARGHVVLALRGMRLGAE